MFASFSVRKTCGGKRAMSVTCVHTKRNQYMKSLAKLFALTLSITAFSAAFAADGPLLSTLVTIDESKYDMENKQFVEKSDVLSRLTKETYVREIFKVKERVAIPYKYVVQENRDPYVLVNPQEAHKWVYQNR
jgi:hypothetical protein